MPFKLITLFSVFSICTSSFACEKRKQKKIAPLIEVVVDMGSDTDSSSGIVGFSTSSSSSSSLSFEHKNEDRFKYLPADVTQNILIVDMAEFPRQAGRLTTVCKTWNTIVNDEKTVQAVIMRNPTYYANNLMCAGCARLNDKQLPPSCIEQPEASKLFMLPTPGVPDDADAERNDVIYENVENDGLGYYWARSLKAKHAYEREKEKWRGCACVTSIIVGPLIGGGIGVIGLATTNSGWFFAAIPFAIAGTYAISSLVKSTYLKKRLDK